MRLPLKRGQFWNPALYQREEEENCEASLITDFICWVLKPMGPSEAYRFKEPSRVGGNEASLNRT